MANFTQPESILIKVKRRDSATSNSYWEEFKIPYKPNMNVVSVLMEVRKNPVNASGKTVDPVVWECNCLEEVCGACSMLVNGVPRQSCSALIDKIYEQKGTGAIILEPLTKFPVIRDLMIDRQKMFDNLKRVKAWVPVDGSFAIGRGPRMNPTDNEMAYHISRCMTCGCCTEACPNFNHKSKFIGPYAVAQVRMFNAHPIGKMHKDMRLKGLIEKGGIQECGNSQNCKEVCPKSINLTEHLAVMNRQSNGYAFRRFFNK